MKQIILICLRGAFILLYFACFFSTKTFGQNDSVGSFTDTIKSRKLPAGFYYSVDDFIRGIPSLIETFNVVPNYQVWNNTKTNVQDTIEVGVTYEVAGKPNWKPPYSPFHPFAFSDGENAYLQNGNAFFKFDFVGRYSFATVLYDKNKKDEDFHLLYDLPFSSIGNVIVNLAANGINQIATKKKSHLIKTVFFITKKGNMAEATPDTFRWFLEKDRDLAKESFKIKKHTAEDYAYFLMKMNKRYPE